MDISLTTTQQLSAVFETGTIDLSLLQPVLEQYAASMVEDARDQWPVDTGISRDAWQAEVEADADSLSVVVFNNARQRGRGYSVYVHRSGERRLVWTEVQERLTADIIPSLQADIALTLAEEFRS
jgi:hypothetical protein